MIHPSEQEEATNRGLFGEKCGKVKAFRQKVADRLTVGDRLMVASEKALKAGGGDNTATTDGTVAAGAAVQSDANPSTVGAAGAAGTVGAAAAAAAMATAGAATAGTAGAAAAAAKATTAAATASGVKLTVSRKDCSSVPCKQLGPHDRTAAEAKATPAKAKVKTGAACVCLLAECIAVHHASCSASGYPSPPPICALRGVPPAANSTANSTAAIVADTHPARHTCRVVCTHRSNRLASSFLPTTSR